VCVCVRESERETERVRERERERERELQGKFPTMHTFLYPSHFIYNAFIYFAWAQASMGSTAMTRDSLSIRFRVD